MCYCVESPDLIISEFLYRFLILLLWRQLGLFKLSLRWHKVYGIYIRVFLFGLSLRRNNIINSQSELVQLVLFTLVFNACLMSLRKFVCVFAHDTVFNVCFSIQIYQYTWTYLILKDTPMTGSIGAAQRKQIIWSTKIMRRREEEDIPKW